MKTLNMFYYFSSQKSNIGTAFLKALTLFWFFNNLLAFNNLKAQTSKNTPDSSSEKTNKILPIAFYTPETRIGVGGLFYKVFRSSKSDSSSQKSIIQTYLDVTQNKQYALENDWRLFAKQGKYMFTGRLDYTRFPEFFYGIGNNTLHNLKDLYSFDQIKMCTKNQKRIGKSWFFGISNELQYLFSVARNTHNRQEDERSKGLNGYFINGLGLTLTLDKRNNVLNTTKGSFLEISSSTFPRFLGGKFAFTKFTLDARKYFTIGKVSLGGQVIMQLNKGDVPFRAMPGLGGASNLRGYYRGRFRDNNMTLAQIEMRMPLFWRIGLATFTGMGQVAPKVSEFNTKEFKYILGTGLRYNINKKENVNARLDIGLTNEGYGFYVVFAEAF
jgi:outer membrane protein assembly factor BamA